MTVLDSGNKRTTFLNTVVDFWRVKRLPENRCCKIRLAGPVVAPETVAADARLLSKTLSVFWRQRPMLDSQYFCLNPRRPRCDRDSGRRLSLILLYRSTLTATIPRISHLMYIPEKFWVSNVTPPRVHGSRQRCHCSSARDGGNRSKESKALSRSQPPWAISCRLFDSTTAGTWRQAIGGR